MMLIRALKFRPALISEAAEIFDLHVASVRSLCAKAYPRNTIDSWFSDRDASFYLRSIKKGAVYVAELRRSIAGFIEVNPGEITNIFVRPELSKKGVGSFLLQNGLDILNRGKRCEILIEATLNAVPFYCKKGFRETGRGEWVSPTGAVKIPIVCMKLDRHP
ncbi:MAG: GNAT family N-acetyltransferase [Deltaproteobacteria bacterium]|nr:GNAT family N-acetyltransferase [Deltaproteobacteria bacterium]